MRIDHIERNKRDLANSDKPSVFVNPKGETVTLYGDKAKRELSNLKELGYKRCLNQYAV